MQSCRPGKLVAQLGHAINAGRAGEQFASVVTKQVAMAGRHKRGKGKEEEEEEEEGGEEKTV